MEEKENAGSRDRRDLPASAGAFCVVCGATGVELFGALCAKCRGKKGGLVTIPERTEVVLCPMCGSRQVGRHWERGPPPGLFRSEDIDSNILVTQPARLVSVHWEELGRNPLLRMFEGKAIVELGGSSLEITLKTELREIHHMCPQCSRREGRFYTATIQFRPVVDEPTVRKTEDFKRNIRDLIEEFLEGAPRIWREAVAREEELKEGWDLFLMDTAVAKSMAKALKLRTGASTKESASLWGVKDGRQVYRVTILLRFPPLMVGDFLERDGKLLQIIRQEGEKVKVVEVDGGHADQITTKELLARSRFVGGLERIAQAEVEKGTPPRAVDPDSGEPMSFKGEAPGEDSIGGRVQVVIDRDGAWWTPRVPLRRRWRSH
jgi:nonsense-mediated mRNA decay protein 3